MPTPSLRSVAGITHGYSEVTPPGEAQQLIDDTDSLSNAPAQSGFRCGHEGSGLREVVGAVPGVVLVV